MRYLISTALLVVWMGTAHALTPPPDNSIGFFAGEWAGSGEHGGYCYLQLAVDGSGRVLIDGGAGDWRGAAVQWRNRQQSLQVEKILPFAASPRLRLMPLEKFVLVSGMNQSLMLTWNEQSTGCQLQKVETTARHLKRARSAIDGLPAGGQ